MSEVLNIDRLHRNGKAELEVGIRGNGFLIKRDETTDDLIITDLKNNYSVNLNELANQNTIMNSLHYYSNKDITYNEKMFSIIDSILYINCANILNGELVIPYNLEKYNSISVARPENISKIIIPRGMELINNEVAMSDEDLVSIFANLKIIVRIHNDGAVLSYNVETAELN